MKNLQCVCDFQKTAVVCSLNQNQNYIIIANDVINEANGPSIKARRTVGKFKTFHNANRTEMCGAVDPQTTAFAEGGGAPPNRWLSGGRITG